MKAIVITIEKVTEFGFYWANAHTPQRVSTLSGAEWDALEWLVENFKIVEQGLTSPDYAATYRERLITLCDSPETIIAFRELAMRLIQ